MQHALRHRAAQSGREAGSIIPLVPIVIFAFFVLGGLVIDGSRDLNARGEAQAYAEEAARAGATAVDLTQSILTLDPALARDRVEGGAGIEGYCPTLMRQNSAVVSCRLNPSDPFTSAVTCGDKRSDIVVNTQVVLRIHTSLLGLVGIQTLTTSAQAKARPYEGTTAGNAC